MQWYTFKLSSGDEAGFDEAKKAFSDLQTNSEGIMGIALFNKKNSATKENIFYAVIPVSMTDVAESVFRRFPLVPCDRPAGKELTHLLSSPNDFDDYIDICKPSEA